MPRGDPISEPRPSEGRSRGNEREGQPPVPLVESFNPHRQPKHGRVGQQKRKGERLLSRRRESISEPGFGEKPSQKAHEDRQADKTEVSKKPHSGVMGNLALEEPEAAEAPPRIGCRVNASRAARIKSNLPC